jgi:hypothetical protein
MFLGCLLHLQAFQPSPVSSLRSNPELKYDKRFSSQESGHVYNKERQELASIWFVLYLVAIVKLLQELGLKHGVYT